MGKRESAEQEYTADGMYMKLREMALGVRPEELGLMTPIAGDEVWGCVMETGYASAVATLVTFADGTVSLYFSTGGGIIGLGPHEGPRRAAWDLLGIAPRFLTYCRSTVAFPFPKRGHTRFYLLTGHGPVTAEVPESDLGNGGDTLSPLFHAAQELIHEIRLLNEELRGREGAAREGDAAGAGEGAALPERGGDGPDDLSP